MSARQVGRFAPSPSGYLHLGNLLALLLAWLDCRSLGGELVFRLEDCTDLAWYGPMKEVVSD